MNVWLVQNICFLFLGIAFSIGVRFWINYLK